MKVFYTPVANIIGSTNMVEDIQRGDSNSSKPIRILHVEDEKGALEITKLFLKRKGYNNFKITPVLSAEQTLEKLKYESFDILLSDYKMPGMNGLEFLEELRKNGNDIPFIIFTGKGEEKVAMEAINKGANRYIKKEGSPNVLFDTLGQYILEVAEEKKKERERIAKELEEKNKKQPLIQALEYREWNVRMGAAWALGKIRDTGAVESLIQTLNDEDEDVRKSTAEALGEIGSIGAVEPLIQTLKDRKRDVRRSAAEALGKIGEPALEPLIQAMKDESENVRLGAVEALGEIRDARAIEPLIQVLGDENRDLRWSAMEALEKIGKPAIEPLISILRDKDAGVRKSAAAALGKIGDKRAIEPLIQAWKGENEDVRKVAEKALEKIQMSKERSLARGYIEPDIAKKIVTSSRKPATKYPKEEKVKRREEEVMLTPRQIKEIRDLHARGSRDSNIAMWMGISEKSVTKYLKGVRVRRIEGTYLHMHRRRI